MTTPHTNMEASLSKRSGSGDSGPERSPQGPDLTSRTGMVGNLLFKGFSTFSAFLILLILAAVAVFLLIQAWPALSDPSATFGRPGGGEEVSLAVYTGPLIFGTVLGAVIAMVIAVPISVGLSLFLVYYVNKKMGKFLGYLVDLLAAIPSIIYGLWGIMWLTPRVKPFFAWVGNHLGWFPLFGGPASATGKSMATVGLILAIMILPIITSVTREILLQTPKLHEEAALGLGATRWEMIRLAVLPFARPGIISASMLGLGRALGETMAVVMVLSVGSTFNWSIIKSGVHNTIAANIALQFPESSGIDLAALIATGLALFVITLVVNFIARWIVARRAEFSGAN